MAGPFCFGGGLLIYLIWILGLLVLGWLKAGPKR
jgi:hypothetical protein